MLMRERGNWLLLVSCDRERTSIIIEILIPQVPLEVVDRFENSSQAKIRGSRSQVTPEVLRHLLQLHLLTGL